MGRGRTPAAAAAAAADDDDDDDVAAPTPDDEEEEHRQGAAYHGQEEQGRSRGSGASHAAIRGVTAFYVLCASKRLAGARAARDGQTGGIFGRQGEPAEGKNMEADGKRVPMCQCMPITIGEQKQER